MSDRLTDVCPKCGEIFWYWIQYGWGSCENCEVEGAVIIDDCPYCSRKVIIVGSMAFCLSCGLEKPVEELRQIQIAEHDLEYKELMQSYDGGMTKKDHI